MKKYSIAALVYACVAIIFGVFYREFTKGMEFVGQTNLSLIHTHYFVLGMLIFLVLTLLEKTFSFSDSTTKKLEIVYHIGLNVAGLGFLLRGLMQVIKPDGISNGFNAAISGISGIGHILLSVALIWFLVKLICHIRKNENEIK